MKFYSELINKVYDTEKDCMKAEQEYKQALEAKKREEEIKKLAEKKKQEARADAAKYINELREEMVEAQRKYRDAIEDFVAKYGSYHFTTNSFDGIPHLFEFFGL